MPACSERCWLGAAAQVSRLTPDGEELVSGVAAFDTRSGEAESAQLSGLLARSS